MPEPPPKPEDLGERIRFKILRITKDGKVTVMITPKVSNTMLSR